MRWMLLTETYPPEINGVAMTLSKLAAGLVSRGHSVHIIRPQQSRHDKSVPLPNNPSQTLVWGVPLFWYQDLKVGVPYFGQLRHEINKFKPDVLHVATEGFLGLSSILAAHAYKVPVVSSYHTNFFTYSRYYKATALRRAGFEYFRVLHNATLRTYVPSQTMLQKLRAYNYQNLEIMARGVDTQLYTPALRSDDLRRSWGVGPGDIAMLYVGRLAAEKNLPLMIKAYERLRQQHPSAKLILVGDGPHRAQLEAEYPHFVFVGKRTSVDLARHYASADLFAFTSITETFGNVITEAMASGLPVLAYDYAAARDHIQDGVNGFLVPFNNETEYLLRFDELIAQREKWPQIAAAARQTALSLSWENIVAKYEESVLKLKPNAR